MKKEIKILGGIIVAVVAAAVIGTLYYRSTVQNERVAATNTNTSKPRPDAALLIRPDSPSIGPADAKATVVEFYDPECESCAEFEPIVKKVLTDYNGKTLVGADVAKSYGITDIGGKYAPSFREATGIAPTQYGAYKVK